MSVQSIKERFTGCILGGAIGDAHGSVYENQASHKTTFTYWGENIQKQDNWCITDDTQLTLATCEALAAHNPLLPEQLATYLVRYYRQGKITGIGASTLKAIKDLEAGIHWKMAGRSGDYAAGNGAAMRVAPLAFRTSVTRQDLEAFCRITHNNDEAYTGALTVFLALRTILNNDWDGSGSLLQLLIPQLPDTNVRDRLTALQHIDTITAAAKFGTGGYVADSIPFAVFAAAQVTKSGFENMLQEVIDAGGDTDTNASIAGQIAGTFLGASALPGALKNKLRLLPDYSWIQSVIDNTYSSLSLFQ